MHVLRLFLVLALAAAAPRAAGQDCGPSFYWKGDEGSIAVWPEQNLIRIELEPTDERPEAGVPSGARLILQAPVAALSDRLGHAGLSVTPPAVQATSVQSQVRLRFGRRRSGSHVARADIVPGAGQPDVYQAWADFAPGAAEGRVAVEQFRQAEDLTAVLVSRTPHGGWREQTQARFSWAGVEALAALGRAWLARCAAA